MGRRKKKVEKLPMPADQTVTYIVPAPTGTSKRDEIQHWLTNLYAQMLKGVLK